MYPLCPVGAREGQRVACVVHSEFYTGLVQSMMAHDPTERPPSKPNTTALPNLASSLANASPDAKKVYIYIYSIPTASEYWNNVSRGSLVVRVRSSSGFRSPNPFAGPSASPGGDGECFNPSDYLGNENSIHQAVAVPMVASGRVKLVQVRPPRAINAAASGSQSCVGVAMLLEH